MYEQTLYTRTKQSFQLIKGNPAIKDFYLAGGTALALQLGHRKSIDLDFFSSDFPLNDVIIQKLKSLTPTVLNNTSGTLDLMVNDTKISFIKYDYPMLKNYILYEGIKLASVDDISCMKVSAISSRGTKKDFVDLYAIIKSGNSLDSILQKFDKKYSGVKYERFHLLKSLIYFDDAEDDPDPDYIEDIKWSRVKEVLTTQVAELTRRGN